MNDWNIESYSGMALAVLMASQKKVHAGLKHAASGKHQDYPPGILELGIALDAIDMLVNDVARFLVADISPVNHLKDNDDSQKSFCSCGETPCKCPF